LEYVDSAWAHEPDDSKKWVSVPAAEPVGVVITTNANAATRNGFHMTFAALAEDERAI
jgi:hypothetical protein